MTELVYGEEVVVSYLPLSHVAAQVNDLWISVKFAGTTYFASPDALKVRSGPSVPSARWSLVVLTTLTLTVSPSPGLAGGHPEGGAAHGLPGGPTRLGEDAGEDEGGRGQGVPAEDEGGGLGQGPGPAVQLQRHEQVSPSTAAR